MTQPATSLPPELLRPARLVVFGESPLSVTAWVIARSDRWRRLGALRNLSVGLVIAPFVFLVPPHLPWALGALGTGALLAWRRLTERLTLLALQGNCPRCEHPIVVDKPVRMRTPHTLPCPGCQYEMTLSVDVSVPA